jgi:hypothetical protein
MTDATGVYHRCAAPITGASGANMPSTNNH